MKNVFLVIKPPVAWVMADLLIAYYLVLVMLRSHFALIWVIVNCCHINL